MKLAERCVLMLRLILLVRTGQAVDAAHHGSRVLGAHQPARVGRPTVRRSSSSGLVILPEPLIRCPRPTRSTPGLTAHPERQSMTGTMVLGQPAEARRNRASHHGQDLIDMSPRRRACAVSREGQCRPHGGVANATTAPAA